MVSDITIDTRELEILAQKFNDLGGKFRDNTAIKAAFKQAANYLIKQGKSNLRTRVKDQANWQILSWFAVKVGKHGNYSLAGFKMPNTHWNKGEHHGLPWWLDQGTAERHTKSGHYTGAATPNYFWEDVKRKDWSTAAQYVIDALRSEIAKIEL